MKHISANKKCDQKFIDFDLKSLHLRYFEERNRISIFFIEPDSLLLILSWQIKITIEKKTLSTLKFWRRTWTLPSTGKLFFHIQWNSVVTNSVVNEHSVITNTQLGKIKATHFKSGMFRATTLQNRPNKTYFGPRHSKSEFRITQFTKKIELVG